MFEEVAKQRMSEGGKNKGKVSTDSAYHRQSRDDASRVFKVGVNAVQQAKTLLAPASDLAWSNRFLAPGGCRVAAAPSRSPWPGAARTEDRPG
jgi:hypothetical protein